MANDGNSIIARRVLHQLDNSVVREVKRNAEVVDEFAKRLQICLGTSVLFRGCDVMHGGSAYESLAVTEKTDFDIVIVLGEPFVNHNFEIARDPSGFFTLKWKHLNYQPTDRYGFLDAMTLQNQLFQELASCVHKVHLMGKTVTCKPQLSALYTEIQTPSTKISVDLVPLIAVRSWDEFPNLVNLSRLPGELRHHVMILSMNRSPILFLSPAVPGSHQYVNGNRLCNVSFNMLEKNFLNKNPGVRDMVRLVKYVAEKRNWKAFGLKSFHIKRVALKYFDHLQYKSLWAGYKCLLENMLLELKNYTIDGFFVTNQKILQAKPEKIDELYLDITKVKSWDAQFLN